MSKDNAEKKKKLEKLLEEVDLDQYYYEEYSPCTSCPFRGSCG